MPPTTEDRLRDIIEAIDAIQNAISTRSIHQFAADELLRMGIERYLEIICEASRRLPDEFKSRAPDIDWRRMVDFGNLLRHAYHATDVDIVWAIVHNHLPPLKAIVESHISSSGKSS